MIFVELLRLSLCPRNITAKTRHKKLFIKMESLGWLLRFTLLAKADLHERLLQNIKRLFRKLLKSKNYSTIFVSDKERL
jgi:hypothetical protein